MQEEGETSPTQAGRLVFISASYLWQFYKKVPGLSSVVVTRCGYSPKDSPPIEGLYFLLWKQAELEYVIHFATFHAWRLHLEQPSHYPLVFPSTHAERKESALQPTQYGKMEEEFKSLILEKEKEGRVYWLKPDRDYRKVSESNPFLPVP